MWATVGLHPHDAVNGTDGLEALVAEARWWRWGSAASTTTTSTRPATCSAAPSPSRSRSAKRHDLALVVHTREAWDDTFAIFDAEGMPDRHDHPLLHGRARRGTCLPGSGAYLSFSGIVTFRNAAEVREAAVLCPSDRLLVETDSPFLAPVPYRGATNQPSWVPVVGAAVAEARGVDPATVAATVWENAAAVFRLP